MTRRASRSPGARARRPGAPPAAAEPLAALRALESKRGTAAAERALDHWERAAAESLEVFGESASVLATGNGLAFSAHERWFLLAILSEMHRDADLDELTEALEMRLDTTAQAWPGNAADQLDDATLRDQSPVYLALAEAQQAVLLAAQVSYLEQVGRADMARALMHDPDSWDRAMRDGEATLLGGARIVMTADDDPFGILLP